MFFLSLDFKKGFGGAHGIDERAKDKSAVGFDYRAPVEKHSSQTGSLIDRTYKKKMALI